MSLLPHPFVPGRSGQRWIWLSLGSVAVAEMAARSAPDALVVDLQHGLWERQALDAAVAIAGARLPVIARCADASAHALSTALDSGAAAVLVPMVESAEEVQRLVQRTHLPPRGQRSAGGVRPLMHGGAGLVQADAQVRLGVMIETARGVAAAAEICAVPGLDFVFIGTGDLGLSLGPARQHELEDCCAQVLHAAMARGLPCGRFTADADECARMLLAGHHHAVAATDLGLLNTGFAQALRVATLHTPGTSCPSGPSSPPRQGNR